MIYTLYILQFCQSYVNAKKSFIALSGITKCYIFIIFDHYIYILEYTKMSLFPVLYFLHYLPNFLIIIHFNLCLYNYEHLKETQS